MNKAMIAAALLSAGTLLLHVIAGGQDVQAPIEASGLALDLRAISAVIWHFVSLVLALQTIAFWGISQRKNDALAWYLIATQFGFAALFVLFGAVMLGTLWVMPQWTIFFVIGGLALWGLRK